MQQQAVAETAHLVKAREAEKECLAQLQEQFVAEEQGLFHLRQEMTQDLQQQVASPPPEISGDRLQAGGFGHNTLCTHKFYFLLCFPILIHKR